MTGDDLKLSPSAGAQDRFDNLFYSKSDEKFVVRALLEQIFADRKFARSLDIGPGAGHVSEPLAVRSNSIMMVETKAEFDAILKHRFPNATVVIDSIADAAIEGPFDVILFSHVLYYLPAESWLELAARLHGMLSAEGELVILLNADCGDWWRLVSAFWDELKTYIGFDYIEASQFRKQLAQLGPLTAHPYRYQMWIDSGLSWSQFVGSQILELSDQKVLRQNEQRFNDLARSFKRVDDSYVLNMRAEIIRIRASRELRH